jgi:hypothetical protein
LAVGGAELQDGVIHYESESTFYQNHSLFWWVYSTNETLSAGETGTVCDKLAKGHKCSTSLRTEEVLGTSWEAIQEVHEIVCDI